MPGAAYHYNPPVRYQRSAGPAGTQYIYRGKDQFVQVRGAEPEYMHKFNSNGHKLYFDLDDDFIQYMKPAGGGKKTRRMRRANRKTRRASRRH